MENEEAKQVDLTPIQIIESVKDTTEFKTLLENSNKSFWSNNIGSEVKTIYSNLDNKVKDVLGMDKPDNVKTSEWIAQHLTEYKATKEELNVLKSKGDTNTEQEELWKAKFNKLSNDLKQKESAINQLTQQGFEQNISNKIDNILALKTFKAMDDMELRDLVDVRKNRIIQNTKQLDNGKTVYYNPVDQTPYLDTLGEPMSLESVASIHFNTLFLSKTAGGNAEKELNTAVDKGDVIAIDMNEIKSKQDFFNQFKTKIAPKGLASHEQSYLKIQRATMEHYKINELPLS
jgi:hypothetical protein